MAKKPKNVEDALKQFGREAEQLFNQGKLRTEPELIQYVNKRLEEEGFKHQIPDLPLFAEMAERHFAEALSANNSYMRNRNLLMAMLLEPNALGPRLFAIRTLVEDPSLRVKLLLREREQERQFLGAEMFEKGKGHFWLMAETRDYMRVSSELVHEAMVQENWAQGIKVSEEMLELCPGDNLGIRSKAAILFMVAEDWERANRLLRKQYPDDTMPQVLWSRVLLEYLEDKQDALEQALADARKYAGKVEKYLRGTKKLPKEPLPIAGYFAGSEEEAENAARDLILAWQQHPKAIKWLEEVNPHKNKGRKKKDA